MNRPHPALISMVWAVSGMAPQGWSYAALNRQIFQLPSRLDLYATGLRFWER